MKWRPCWSMKQSCGSWVNTYFWLMATRVKTLYYHKFVLSDSFGQISTHKLSRDKNACHVMFSFYFTRMQIVSKITGAQSVLQSVFTTLLKEFFINLFATNLNQKLSISILNCLVYGSSTRITLISTLLWRKETNCAVLANSWYWRSFFQAVSASVAYLCVSETPKSSTI